MAEFSFAQANGPSVTGEPDDDYDPVLDVSGDAASCLMSRHGLSPSANAVGRGRSQ
jgi:hypothetical protein